MTKGGIVLAAPAAKLRCVVIYLFVVFATAVEGAPFSIEFAKDGREEIPKFVQDVFKEALNEPAFLERILRQVNLTSGQVRNLIVQMDERVAGWEASTNSPERTYLIRIVHQNPPMHSSKMLTISARTYGEHLVKGRSEEALPKQELELAHQLGSKSKSFAPHFGFKRVARQIAGERGTKSFWVSFFLSAGGRSLQDLSSYDPLEHITARETVLHEYLARLKQDPSWIFVNTDTRYVMVRNENGKREVEFLDVRLGTLDDAPHLYSKLVQLQHELFGESPRAYFQNLARSHVAPELPVLALYYEHRLAQMQNTGWTKVSEVDAQMEAYEQLVMTLSKMEPRISDTPNPFSQLTARPTPSRLDLCEALARSEDPIRNRIARDTMEHWVTRHPSDLKALAFLKESVSDRNAGTKKSTDEPVLAAMKMIGLPEIVAAKTEMEKVALQSAKNVRLAVHLGEGPSQVGQLEEFGHLTVVKDGSVYRANVLLPSNGQVPAHFLEFLKSTVRFALTAPEQFQKAASVPALTPADIQSLLAPGREVPAGVEWSRVWLKNDILLEAARAAAERFPNEVSVKNRLEIAEQNDTALRQKMALKPPASLPMVLPPLAIVGLGSTAGDRMVALQGRELAKGGGYFLAQTVGADLVIAASTGTWKSFAGWSSFGELRHIIGRSYAEYSLLAAGGTGGERFLKVYYGHPLDRPLPKGVRGSRIMPLWFALLGAHLGQALPHVHEWRDAPKVLGEAATQSLFVGIPMVAGTRFAVSRLTPGLSKSPAGMFAQGVLEFATLKALGVMETKVTARMHEEILRNQMVEGIRTLFASSFSDRISRVHPNKKFEWADAARKLLLAAGAYNGKEKMEIEARFTRKMGLLANRTALTPKERDDARYYLAFERDKVERELNAKWATKPERPIHLTLPIPLPKELVGEHSVEEKDVVRALERMLHVQWERNPLATQEQLEAVMAQTFSAMSAQWDSSMELGARL